MQSIRWGDMDAFDHVNNTVYFRYMEQARIEWLYAFAAAQGDAGPSEASVIVNASCDFLIPLVYPGDIEVRMFLAHPGRTSVGTFYEIRQGECLYAQGASKIVWIDRATGRSRPMPAAIAALFRAPGE
jgi:acyl-CoA thioester hydrolase